MLTAEGMETLRQAVDGLRRGDAAGWNALAPLSRLAAQGADVTIDFTTQDQLGAPLVIVRQGTAAALPATLTPRQRAVARCLARGLSNKAIARELGIAPATVKDHVGAILAVLGLGSCAEIIARLHGAQTRSGPAAVNPP